MACAIAVADAGETGGVPEPMKSGDSGARRSRVDRRRAHPPTHAAANVGWDGPRVSALALGGGIAMQIGNPRGNVIHGLP